MNLPISGVTLKNTVCKSATSERLCGDNGVPYPPYLRYYERVFDSGLAGLVITGHAAVCKAARAESYQLYSGGDPEECEQRRVALRALTAAAHQCGIIILAQLSHCGTELPRYLHSNERIGYTPVRRALGVFERRGFVAPDSDHVVEEFVNAAGFFLSCGFDGVQVHCAHGYLLDDCLRCGNSELPGRVVTRIRELYPKATLLLKISGEMANIPFIVQHQRLVDAIEVSKGDYNCPADMTENFANMKAVAFAAHLKTLGLACRIVATGGIETIQQGQELVAQGKCDVAGFGRLFCCPEMRRVVRMRNNALERAVVAAVRFFVPLANAGPQTVWYQETIRRIGRGAIGRDSEMAVRCFPVWWLCTALCWAAGGLRFRGEPSQ